MRRSAVVICSSCVTIEATMLCLFTDDPTKLTCNTGGRLVLDLYMHAQYAGTLYTSTLPDRTVQ